MLTNLTSLATLPLRLALRGAEMLLRAAGAVGGANGSGWGEDDRVAAVQTAAPVRPRAPEPETETAVEATPVETTAVADPPPPAAAEAPVPDEEDHVSEEPVLVEEFADPGAEDGAGPEISIGEPWPSYGSMKADEVIARLEEADSAAVAVARLYEQANRRRKTVLAAADRRLKLLGL